MIRTIIKEIFTITNIPIIFIHRPITSGNNNVKEKIVANIVSILSKDPLQRFLHNGLEQAYVQTFKESLPKNWLDLINDCQNRIEVEKQEFSNVTKFLICLPQKRSSTRTSLSPQLSKCSSQESIGSELPGAQVLPASLILPNTPTWEVIISNVDNSAKVYVRLNEHNDNYVDLVEEMHNYYSSSVKHLTSSEISVGKLYAAVSENVTHRVEVQSVDGNDCTCFLIDEGIVDVYDASAIRDILPKFLNLPFQAFVCHLDQLEIYSDNNLVTEKLKELLRDATDKVYMAYPISREDPISIQLVDTTKDVDIFLNSEILEYAKNVSFDETFKIDGAQNKVFVTFCDDKGHIYLQFEDHIYGKFEQLQTKVNELCESCETIPNTEDITQNEKTQKLYFYNKYDESGNWSRVQATMDANENMLRVFYLDYGNEDFVDFNKLRFIESESDPWFRFPFMATKCLLHNVPKNKWTKETTEEFFKIYPADESLCLRVLKAATDYSIPEVELRRESSVKSINEELIDVCFKDVTNQVSNVVGAMSSSNVNGILKKNKETKKVIGLVNVSGDGLEDIKSVPIPLQELPTANPRPKDGDDFFDVYVTLAANPYNFWVIPYKSLQENSEFTLMKQEMRKFYEDKENNFSELMSECFTEGMYVAVRHKEGNEELWYRAKIEKIVSEEPLQVLCSFVDYGDIRNVERKDIEILYTQFRKLPKQVMKASLKCKLLNKH